MTRLVLGLDFLRRHPSLALDLIRIYLGTALAVRGVLLVADSSTLLAHLGETGRDWFVPTAVLHYVSLAHLGGGILLALGFLTRLAALIQVPVLAGAVFFVHLRDGLLAPGQSLELSALVLFLLLVVLVFGPGRISCDYLFARDLAAEDRAAPSRNGTRWRPTF